ncbi:MAG: 8-amino-7-oxononanoate synthase [Candidatus Margulisiibacteriota bacterium]
MPDFIKKELARLKKDGLYRQLKQIGPATLVFCSNDYLGLSQHPRVKAAAIAAIAKYGFGAGASRLVSGNSPLQEELERKIANFKGRAAAIVFPTGYMANLGAISSLVDENDTVIIDRLDHASIIDACKLTKAKLQVYRHNDPAALEAILKRSAKFKKRLIVTDSVFSMDGDLAPLPEIVALARKYDALTMIDEAHATGTIGQTGRGLEEHFGLKGQVDIVMGTLSKAVGSVGGFVAGSAELINYLRNKARSFIYTTALPPAACATSLEALKIIEQEPELLRNLRMNSRFLREKVAAVFRPPYNGDLKVAATTSGSDEIPIIPIIIGDSTKTMEISRKLLERSIFVSAIRPPTVPQDQSRLRITISAVHKKEDIVCLASSLRELIPASAKRT